MATQATVQAKVSYGYGKAAAILGSTCVWYRPSGVGNPLLGPYQPAEVLFDTAPNLEQKTLSDDRKPENWYAATSSPLLAGDYLVDAKLGAFFVEGVEPFKPFRLVSCNAQVTISEAAGSQSVGAVVGYNTDLRATETILAMQWPCAISQGTKGERGDTNLPGDVRAPWFAVQLPISLRVALRNTTILTDANGQRFVLSSVVLTTHGWRCTAVLETT